MLLSNDFEFEGWTSCSHVLHVCCITHNSHWVAVEAGSALSRWLQVHSHSHLSSWSDILPSHTSGIKRMWEKVGRSYFIPKVREESPRLQESMSCLFSQSLQWWKEDCAQTLWFWSVSTVLFFQTFIPKAGESEEGHMLWFFLPHALNIWVSDTCISWEWGFNGLHLLATTNGFTSIAPFRETWLGHVSMWVNLESFVYEDEAQWDHIYK